MYLRFRRVQCALRHGISPTTFLFCPINMATYTVGPCRFKNELEYQSTMSAGNVSLEQIYTPDWRETNQANRFWLGGMDDLVWVRIQQ